MRVASSLTEATISSVPTFTLCGSRMCPLDKKKQSTPSNCQHKQLRHCCFCLVSAVATRPPSASHYGDELSVLTQNSLDAADTAIQMASSSGQKPSCLGANATMHAKVGLPNLIRVPLTFLVSKVDCVCSIVTQGAEYKPANADKAGQPANNMPSANGNGLVF